ncbi:MAG: two-component sensor histidine kinase [Silicimonas sp.]|nr:two-component sensor histidine kinase [Silicimonas sp.]
MTPGILLNALPIAAVWVNASGRIEAMNLPAETLFGGAAIGRHYITVMRQPALLDAIETALRKGVVEKAIYQTTEARKDITLEATCSPTEDGSGILVCFEDRTEMEEAGQMRRDFVANVSHELRTPLTALLGFMETLRGAARNDPEARDRFLGIMEREANRMNRLVGDLLSLGRVEAEARVRPTKEIDLAAIIRSVMGTLRPQAEERGIEIIEEGCATPMVLPGDADQVAQVVTNLVENAIKYSPRSSIVTLKLSRDQHHPMLRCSAVILEVSDQGEGIDAIHLPRLTERFYRIDDHRSREVGGTGLGLAIVKHIVNRHRGRLRIESTKGQGSVFTVILPAEIVRAP